MPVKETPVDYDPFASTGVKETPVDYDPFAAASGFKETPVDYDPFAAQLAPTTAPAEPSIGPADILGGEGFETRSEDIIGPAASRAGLRGASSLAGTTPRMALKVADMVSKIQMRTSPMMGPGPDLSPRDRGDRLNARRAQQGAPLPSLTAPTQKFIKEKIEDPLLRAAERIKLPKHVEEAELFPKAENRLGFTLDFALLNPFKKESRDFLVSGITEAGVSMAPVLLAGAATRSTALAGAVAGSLEGSDVALEAEAAGDTDAEIVGKYAAMALWVAGTEKLALDKMLGPLQGTGIWSKLAGIGTASLFEGAQEVSEAIPAQLARDYAEIINGDVSLMEEAGRIAEALRQEANVLPSAMIVGGGVRAVSKSPPDPKVQKQLADALTVEMTSTIGREELARLRAERGFEQPADVEAEPTAAPIPTTEPVPTEAPAVVTPAPAPPTVAPAVAPEPTPTITPAEDVPIPEEGEVASVAEEEAQAPTRPAASLDQVEELRVNLEERAALSEDIAGEEGFDFEQREDEYREVLSEVADAVGLDLDQVLDIYDEQGWEAVEALMEVSEAEEQFSGPSRPAEAKAPKVWFGDDQTSRHSVIKIFSLPPKLTTREEISTHLGERYPFAEMFRATADPLTAASPAIELLRGGLYGEYTDAQTKVREGLEQEMEELMEESVQKVQGHQDNMQSVAESASNPRTAAEASLKKMQSIMDAEHAKFLEGVKGLEQRLYAAAPEAENAAQQAISGEDFYRKIGDGWVSTQTHAQPAPGVETKKVPVKATRIIERLSKLANLPIRIGRIAEKKEVAGLYKPTEHLARIRDASNFFVALHETAHGLENLYRAKLKISRIRWIAQMPKSVRAELKGLDYDQSKRRPEEGFAEFAVLYGVHENVDRIAPATLEWFEGTFLKDNAKLRKELEGVRSDITKFEEQGPFKTVEGWLALPSHRRKILEAVKKAKGAPDRLVHLWLNNLDALVRMEHEALGGKFAVGEESPSKVAYHIAQSSGVKARDWIDNGPTDFGLNRMGPGLKAAAKLVEGDMNGALTYALAKHSLEILDRTDADGNPLNIDPGPSREDAQYVVDNHATETRAKFSDALNAYSNQMIVYLADAGAISTDDAARILEAYSFYIPMKRVFDESDLRAGKGGGGRGVGDQGKAVQSLKGSRREIVDPLDSLMTYTERVIGVADKTRLARTIVEFAKEHGGLGHWVTEVPADIMVRTFKIGTIADQLKKAGTEILPGTDMDATLTLYSNSTQTPTPENVVAFVENGERKFYELDVDLYRSLQAVDYQRLPAWADMTLGAAARGTRLGATGIDPGFALIRNPIRDAMTAMLQTQFKLHRAGPNLAKTYAQNAVGGLTGQRTEIRDFYESSGVSMSMFFGMDVRSLRKARRDVVSSSRKRKIYNIVTSPLDAIDALRSVMSFSESAARVSEFEMTVKSMGWESGTPMTNNMAVEAGFNAAEITTNFRRGGEYAKRLSQITGFHNAGIQGLTKFGRSHKENFARSFFRGVSLITLPALANWLTYKDDEEWKDMDAWLKWGFINLKIDGEWIHIPTPFDWWIVYGALPMAALDALYKENPEIMLEAVDEAVKQITPPLVPNLVLATHETLSNFSHFRQRDLVPEQQQGLQPEAQFGPYTTETAKTLGRIIGVSPTKLEHFVDGVSGGIASDLVGVSEALILADDEDGPTIEREPASIPAFGGLFKYDTMSAVVTEFYTERDDLRSRNNTYGAMKDVDPKRAEKYKVDLGRLKLFETANKEMSKLRKERDVTPSREGRQRITGEMKELARKTLHGVTVPTSGPKGFSSSSSLKGFSGSSLKGFD